MNVRRNNKWLVMAVVALGTLTTAFSASSLNIANPVLAREFAIGMEQVQWVSSIYLLVMTSLMLLFGRIGDRVGSNKIYILGLAIFALGSLLCSLADNLLLLLVMRVVQAVGGAILLAIGTALIVTAFPLRQRGMAMGLQVTTVGAGSVLGPAVGGLILSVAPWQSLFFAFLPLVLISLVLALFCLRTPKSESASRPQKDALPGLDVPGALLLAVLISSFVLFMSGSFTGSSWFALLFLITLPVFILVERRQRTPLLDFTLLKKSRFALGNLVTFFSYTANMMMTFQLPFFLENIWGLSVGTAGMLLIIPAFAMAVAGPLSGIVSDRIGALKVMPFALALAACAIALTFLLGSTESLPLFIVFLALNGTGMGLVNTPNNSEIMTAAGREKSGYASGFVSTNRNLAFCLGTAASAGLFPFLESAFLGTVGPTDAYLLAFHLVFAVALTLTLISLILCLVLKARHKPQSQEGPSPGC